MKRYFLLLIIPFFILSACQSDGVKRAELANIQLDLKNGASEKIVIEKIEPTKIVTIDSVICDQKGNTIIRVIPQEEEMILLQFSDNSFIPLIVEKNSTTKISADFNHIETTFNITEGFESKQLTQYFRRLFRDRRLSDSLASVLDAATASSDFAKVRENTIFAYNQIYHNHKAFADSMIRKNPTALSNLFILNQSIGRQRLFEMQTDSSLFFLVDDSLTSRFPNHSHVLKNHEKVGEFRAAMMMKQLANQRLQAGNKAPDFTLSDITGQSFSLNSLRGKEVLIIFWASWDGKFRADLELLKMMYNDYQRIGFEIVAVSMDEKEELWKNAVKQQNIRWINVSDLKGAHSPLVRMYNLGETLPEYYLIDKEGIIIAQHPSILEIDDLMYAKMK